MAGVRPDRRADARIRTADPIITSDVLYQLSYVGLGRHSSPAGRPLPNSWRNSHESFTGVMLNLPNRVDDVKKGAEVDRRSHPSCKGTNVLDSPGGK